MNADPATLVVLLSVQEFDRRLDRAAHDRASVPELELVAKIDAVIAGIDVAAAEVSARRHELAREQKRLEDEVALVEDRIVTENGKLYGGSVTAIKELQALQDEISGLKARQATIEDHILEVMELIEPVDAELDAHSARRDEQLAERARLEGVVDDKRAEIDAAAEQAKEQRDEAARNVPDDLLAEYERLRSRPGQVGIARLVGTTCHGCHLDLAAVEADRLKKLPADDLVHCDECGCILVR